MLLYRPVGLEELALIFDSDFQAFPPRLPEQPIFYPVTNRSYAEQIASEWNTKSNSFAGYVTEFSIDDAFVSRYERRVVGGIEHEELWVPAEELEEFNRHLTTPISVVSAFFGTEFRGFVPVAFGLKGRTALEQLKVLRSMFVQSPFDFPLEIAANAKAVFLNFRYWEQHDQGVDGWSEHDLDELLSAIRQVWAERSSTLL